MMKRYVVNISIRRGYCVIQQNTNNHKRKQLLSGVIHVKNHKAVLTLTGKSGTCTEYTETSDSKNDISKIPFVSSKNGKIRIKHMGSPYIPQNFEQILCMPMCNISGNDDTSPLEAKGNREIQLENTVQHEETSSRAANTSNTRVNQINIQMLSKSLHNHIFKNYKQKEISENEIQFIKENLKQYNIDIEDATKLPEVDIKLPPLEGDDIEQHFYNIGVAQTKAYVTLIKKIIEDIPEIPSNWLLKEGWTRYTSNNIESVDYPLEDAVTLDVEVCLKEGPMPTIATAVSNKAWYGWVSKSLIDGSSRNFEGKQLTMDQLIPLESTLTEYGNKLSAFQKSPKIVVGHNVSYDRTKIKEQYWVKQTGLRFLDTMSLHICVGGINSYQRSVLNSKKNTEEKVDLLMQTSLSSLADIHKFYCGSEINKELRNIFVNGTLADIREDFASLMTYCASDVVATHNVFRRLFPIFQERFPHPVTLAGMLELGIAYLPINSNWQKYLDESESTFEDLNYETKVTLAKRANAVCKLMHNEKYKEDLWMWNEDWSTQMLKVKKHFSKENYRKKCTQTEESKAKVTEAEKYLTDEEDEGDPLEKEFAYLKETRKFLPSKLPHMPGYPAWYRKLCPKISEKNWSPGPQNLSTSMQIVPKLLNLTWDNYPLHYVKNKGWGILVPYSNDLSIDTKLPLKQLLALPVSSETRKVSDRTDYAMLTLHKNVEDKLHETEFWRTKRQKPQSQLKNIYKSSAHWCNTDIDHCCYFLKLPHKDGASYNVGNPLAKDFLNKFSEHILAGSDASASEILKIARMLSYWRNNRDRIRSQCVVWFENNYLPSSVKNAKKSIRYGAIIPLVVVCGTLTRRAVEPTWMTAANAQDDRIGSELRAMIQAPPGYNIVGADVDSQELWISSIIGDAYYKKIHGATPFGWMTVIGTKSNGTDMHSVTAKAIGISRNQAKIINYARIYGAGQKFAERLLKQFNPSMTDAEVTSKARKMFALTKGKKVYKLKPEHINELTDRQYSSYEAQKLAKMCGQTVPEMFEKGLWVGGSESSMFNSLEEIANSSRPVTPFLNSRLTCALEGERSNHKYLPTKVNWVVQSGAVDFLHLMLISMRWLMRDNVRFCLSFHDEVRYLVPSRYKYNAALAMHITNLLTRSFCASRLGMKDLPMSVAFFSSVEVDTVLRKESANDCITPSNPHGLKNGYEIPPGESLDVWEAIEKSKGCLGSWYNMNK